MTSRDRCGWKAAASALPGPAMLTHEVSVGATCVSTFFSYIQDMSACPCKDQEDSQTPAPGDPGAILAPRLSFCRKSLLARPQ